MQCAIVDSTLQDVLSCGSCELDWCCTSWLFLVLASKLSPFCSSHVTISTFRPITGTEVDQRWCVFDNQGLGWPRTTRKSWNAGIFRSFLSWTTRVVLAGMFAPQNHGAFECIKCSLLLVNFIVVTQLTVKGTWQICPLSSCSVGKWQIKYWWATLPANLPVCLRFTVQHNVRKTAKWRKQS